MSRKRNASEVDGQPATRAASNPVVRLNGGQFTGIRPICFERSPSKSLKESLAITRQGHSHSITAVTFPSRTIDQQGNRLNPKSDIFKYARLPLHTENYTLGLVYPFVKKNAPGTALVPESLFELQELMLQSLKRHLIHGTERSLLMNETSDAGYSAVWIKLNNKIAASAEGQLRALTEPCLSVQSSILQALTGKPSKAELKSLTQQWDQCKQKDLPVTKEAREELYRIQRKLHALRSWGRGFVACRNGRFDTLHVPHPYNLYLQSENPEAQGRLTVTLEIVAILVPYRTYEKAAPFVGRPIKPTCSERWACAFVRELSGAAVEQSALQTEIENKITALTNQLSER